VHRAVNMIQRIEADGTTPEFEKEKNKSLAFAVFVKTGNVQLCMQCVEVC